MFGANSELASVMEFGFNSNKIESVRLRKYPYYHYLTKKD